MKVLSVRQPWANLIVHGIKDVENRTRRTKHRGRVLIHAPVTVEDPFLYDAQTEAIEAKYGVRKYYEEIENPQNFSGYVSAIIGSVEIVDCIDNSESIWAEEGCWHWIIKNPVLFKNPIINVKGNLGLWNYDMPEEDLRRRV